MRLRVLLTGLIMLSSIHGTIYAQEPYWPAEFGNPDSSDALGTEPDSADDVEMVTEDDTAAIDSSVVQLVGKSAVYQNVVQAHTKLDWQQLVPKGQLDQTVSYQYIKQSQQRVIQTIDGSGVCMFTNVYNSGLNAGLSWNPVVSYAKDYLGALQSNVDLGPVVSGAGFDIPWTLRGGLNGYISNDTITSLFSNTDPPYQTTPGMFGGITLGGKDHLSIFEPLQVLIDASGHASGGNNQGLVRSGAVYADETGIFGGGDSLYCAVGDSITNGKEVYVGEYGGSSFYSNTSWRVNHEFSTSAGIRFRERFATILRSYYRFDQHSISYPNETDQQNDIRNRTTVFGLSARTNRRRPFTYTGGIQFEREFEDHIFKRTFDKKSYPGLQNISTYIINQGDCLIDRAQTDHRLRAVFPGGFSVQYNLTAIKESRHYPFTFIDSLSKEQSSPDENDRVQTYHSALLQFNSDSLFLVELFGKYGRTYQYYYHESRAAESRITSEYRVGIAAKLTIGRLSIRENFYMDADVSDYYFKKIGDKPIDAPPYSRRIESSLTGTLKLTNKIDFNGNWKSDYNDYGYWYGKLYRIDSSATVKDAYAIESKGTNYWVDCWLEYQFDLHRILSIGSRFQDAFERVYDFNAKEYLVSDLDVGYGFEPYLRYEFIGGKFGCVGYIRRIFNTGDSDRWKRWKNWDASFSFNVKW